MYDPYITHSLKSEQREGKFFKAIYLYRALPDPYQQEEDHRPPPDPGQHLKILKIATNNQSKEKQNIRSHWQQGEASHSLSMEGEMS